MSRYLNSLRPYELSLLCAPTGSGKTALLATIARDVALQGIPLFCAPVETGDNDFLIRILSATIGYDLGAMDQLSPQSLARMMNADAVKVISSPTFIANYDSRVDIDEMIAVLEHMAAKGVRLALLDNLNFFLKVSTAEKALVEMDEAVHKLVIFCKRFPMHVILVVHPKKTDGGRVLSEFDIKGSSTAVQEASNVILFNRPEKSDVDNGRRDWSHRELVFKKIRKRGMFVNKPIWMKFQNGLYREI